MTLQKAGHTAFEVSGDGPFVVLIHGLGLHRHMWQWQIDSLTAHFRVVTYDLLGHGESDDVGGDYQMAQMVQQMSELLDHLNIKRCAVVGFSLGGLIAQAFAIAHPQAMQRLVILNSAHNRSDDQRAGIMKRVRQAAELGPEATVSDALARWFTDEFANSNADILLKIRQWIVANDRQVYPRLYRLLAIGDAGLEKSISQISCPTLVITGEEDFGNSPAMAESMAALIPNARAVILPRLRHMALIENARGVNDLIVPFLQGQS